MSSKTKTTATTEEARPALVPKLRYPEFRGADGWQEVDFDDAIFFQEGPGIMAVDFRDEGVPLVRLSGLAGQTVSLEGCNYLDPDKVEQKWSHFRLEAGDIVVSCSASFGRPATVTDAAAGAVFYTGLVRFKAKEGRICVSYLEVFLGSPFFLRQAESFAVGGGIKHFGPSHLRQMKVPLPRIPEQQKLASCLSSVDELITGQARKVDALKTHKKGLMQQLFPREGETLPRLRFPEFRNSGEWEDASLGTVCELYQPVTLSSSELTMTGEHLVYGANGVIGTHNEYNHEESEIAVTCRGATCGEVTITKPQSWITGNAMVVNPRTKKLRKDFIFHYVKNHGLKTVISGSAQPQITRTGFAPLVIFFPKPDEQQRIASCLSSLDALITAETQKLEALRLHKRALMQQLFPSPEEVAA